MSLAWKPRWRRDLAALGGGLLLAALLFYGIAGALKGYRALYPGYDQDVVGTEP